MRDNRLQKITELRANGEIPYKSGFGRTHMLTDVKHMNDSDTCSIAGRVMLQREMGKMAFITLQDYSGRAQIAFKVDVIGDKAFTDAMHTLDLGDFIGITGTKFLTKKGEPTIEVHTWELLSKAIRQPPEKWHGVADQETAWRQRYLDMMSNRSTMDRFTFRSQFIRTLREFYWQHNFLEAETPILVNAASGALATPFKTHHEAYDLDVFLRIAPETFLKECIVGGMDRVFEIGRVFRNEGIDPSHLQDFTMCEHYASYWSYEDNMKFTQDMLRYIVTKLCGSAEVQIPNRDGSLVTVNFNNDWPVYSMQEIILKDCGINIHETKTADELRSAIKKQSIELSVDVSVLGRGNLIDQLYKKVSRPQIIQPTFITKHPVDLSPLARINDDNNEITDRFQLVVGTWEVVNAYSELVDPIDQAERFTAQASAHAAGDSDAHEKDDDYIKALEYGCPPCSGWGMGIDRMVALLTQQHNIREVVLFPLMKPVQSNSAATIKETFAVHSTLKEVSSTINAKSELPNETEKRFIAILNKKVESGKQVNALGHMTAGLSKLASEDTDLCFIEYQDADGGIHPNISHYPFIVLKADNSNKIRTVREEAIKRGIPFTDFTSTMTLGTSQNQQNATKESREEDLEYYGICLFGSTKELKEFTGKFSLFT